MRHESVQDDLKAYCDGELDWLRRLTVQRHLARCAECRQEVYAMQQLHDTLRQTDEQDALSPALRDRILSHVPDIEQPATTAPPPRRRFGSPAFAWGAAAAVFIAWVVLFPVFHKARDTARQVTSAPSGVRLHHITNAAPDVRPRNSLGSPVVTYDTNGSAPDFNVRFSNREAGVDDPRIAISTPPNSADATAADVSLRQVHKEATITVVVVNPEKTSDGVEQMVKSVGGFVAKNELTTDDSGLKTAQMTVKVPEPQFETVLGQIAGLGDVQAKDITGEDITDKTSDADQAESVLEDEVQRSDAHLKQLGPRAKWRDEEQAREVRIELAQARARLVLLHKMAALSTISVTLNEKPKPVPPAATGFTSQLTDTTHAALQSLASSAGVLLALLIWLLAYAPLWVPVVFLVRHFWRRSQRRDAASTP